MGDDTSTRTVGTWRTAADPLGVEIVTVGPRFGKLGKGAEVDRTLHITDPVEYDGVVVATDPDETVAAFAQEAFSFVPPRLIGLASSFRQGESLVAGKLSPQPALLRFGARVSEEGGSDVPATWAAGVS